MHLMTIVNDRRMHGILNKKKVVIFEELWADEFYCTTFLFPVLRRTGGENMLKKLTHNVCYFSPEQCEETRNASCRLFITLGLCYSFISTLFFCFSKEFLSQEAFVHRLILHVFFTDFTSTAIGPDHVRLLLFTEAKPAASCRLTKPCQVIPIKEFYFKMALGKLKQTNQTNKHTKYNCQTLVISGLYLPEILSLVKLWRRVFWDLFSEQPVPVLILFLPVSSLFLNKHSLLRELSSS